MMVAGAVRAFVTGTYTVTRTEAGTYVGGKLVPGSTDTFSIDAGIYPVTGRDLENLPEGQHASETRQVFTETELRTRGAGAPDAIEIDGETWTVLTVSKWPSYYKAIVAREATP